MEQSKSVACSVEAVAEFKEKFSQLYARTPSLERGRLLVLM